MKTYFAFLLVIVVASQVNASVIKNNADGCLLENLDSIGGNFTTPHADQIENLTGKVVQSDSIELKWDNPDEHILTFSVFFGIVGSNEKKILCVSYQEFEEGGRSIIIDNLLPGKYEFTVVIRFVAGYGRQSEPIFVEVVVEIESNYLIFWIISSVGLMVLVFSIFLMFETKRFRQSKLDDIEPSNSFGSFELKRDDIDLFQLLGSGCFGSVYEGNQRNHDESKTPSRVLVETVTFEASLEDSINFLKEAAAIMKNFNTFHVVKLLEIISKSKPYFVVKELMTNNDLKTILWIDRPLATQSDIFKPFTISPVSHMAIQIADGMAYLSKNKFLYRDLAAKNCKVSDDLTVKIEDFGLTRDINDVCLMSVRWMSPKSLKDGTFTSESDVFSYGIVLWEIVTYAEQPYKGKSNPEAMKFIIEGETESRPTQNSSERIYELMTKCWRFNPQERVSFNKIVKELLCETPANFNEKSFYCLNDKEI